MQPSQSERLIEAQLRETQKRLELSLRGANLGTWTYRVATDEFWADDRALHLHGHTSGEATTFAEAGAHIHPEDFDRGQAAFVQSIQTRSNLQIEYRVIWPDHSVHWVESSAEFIPEANSDNGIFYGIVKDITDAKRIGLEHLRAEAALRESEAHFRTIVNLVPALLWQIDPSGQDITANSRWLEYTGQSFEQSQRDGWQAAIHPDDLPNTARVFSEAYARARSLEVEHRIRRHDGVYRWFLVRQVPLLDESGNVVQWLGAAIDIHEQRVALEALRESEERFRLFVTASSDAIYRMSADWREMHSLDGKNFLAHTENPSQTWIETYIPPDEQPRVWADVQKAIQTKSIFELEHRVMQQDGTLGWTFSRAIPVLNEQGEIVEWFGTASDVTERKRTEAALRESEEKYRSLFQSIDEGYAVVEVLADSDGAWNDFLFLEVNPAYEQHTGIVHPVGRKATEILTTPNPAWAQIYGRVVETGESVRFEQNEATLDRIFDLYAVRLGGAESRRVAVVFTDITDRKQAEAQLRHAAEMDAFRVKLSDALRSFTDAVMIQEAACRVLGEHLNVDWVLYSELDWERRVIRTTRDFYRGERREDLPSFIGEYGMNLYQAHAEAFRAGRSMVIGDVETDTTLSEGERVGLMMLSLRALLSTPLVKNRTAVVAIGALSSTPRQWTPEDIALIEEAADRTWDAVERARAEDALRKSEIQRVREQSEREEERQRAESLAELDRAKTLFFSNISHEFRTPLTLLLAPLQDALNDSSLAPVHRDRLELAHRNSLRLLKLVNTLLDFSRIEAGRMEAVYEPTDLSTFTTELASVFRSLIERAGLRLIVDCPPLPDTVYVDREMWEKIVLNLLSNAFKFTFEGEITISLRAESSVDLEASTLTVHDLTSEQQLSRRDRETSGSELDTSTFDPQSSTSELDASTSNPQSSTSELDASGSELDASTSDLNPSTSHAHILLEIRDTGTGIAPEHLPHLFERFYQVRGAQARTHEGSGIGLALVHELVRLQGGTIEVTSTIGVGTCFTIALPFGTDHLPSDRLQDEGDRIPPRRTLASTAMSAASYVEETERWLPIDNNAEENPAPIAPMLAARVLLVDDNADIREYLTRILSEHVQVEAVADGATALSVAQAHPPDLVLSDVMMPALDGFGLLQSLRSDPRTREIPIILLSARAGEEAIVEGLEAGADDYLIKPFSAQELISRVIAHLQMAQLRGAALEAAKSTIRSRDEFLSIVSHELNTPLVSILGWTRLLRANPPSPTMLAKALDTIERNATLQAKLVEDLLDISRITAGKLRLNPQPIEVESVIETAIATVAQTAIDKGIDLTCQKNVTGSIVMGDSDRLGQVFINLLTNAIKFTPESGSVKVELSIRNNDDSADAEIRVMDTGMGIEADFLPHVFEHFRQAKGSGAVGLGLGLAIARRLVELHNGTIEATSAGVGQGTTFTVRLPLLSQATDLA